MSPSETHQQCTSPAALLLQGGGLADVRTLMASFFLERASSWFVPSTFGAQLNLQMEEVSRLAPPEAHARLLCVQRAMGVPLSGTEGLGTDRLEALFANLSQLEMDEPQGMGRLGLAVKQVLLPDVQQVQSPQCKEYPKLEDGDWGLVKRAAFGETRRVLHDLMAAEDISQEATMRTVEAYHRTEAAGRDFPLPARIAYAQKTAHRLALSKIRQEARHREAVNAGLLHDTFGTGTSFDTHAALLGTLLRLGEVAPGHRRYLFGEWTNAPRPLLRTWWGVTPGTYEVGVCKAYGAIEELSHRPLPKRVTPGAVFEQLEPLARGLAEAVLTCRAPWPSDSPTDDEPPHGGGGGGRRPTERNANSTKETSRPQDSTVKTHTGRADTPIGGVRSTGGTMGYDESTQLESPLALLLKHAARTGKSVPAQLLAEADFDELDAQTCETLQRGNPETWAVAFEMRAGQNDWEQGFVARQSTSLSMCTFHILRRRATWPGVLEGTASFVLVSALGVFNTNSINQLQAELACCWTSGAAVSTPRFALLDFTSLVDSAREATVLLPKMVVDIEQGFGADVFAIVADAALHAELTAYGVKVNGSRQEAILAALVGSQSRPEPEGGIPNGHGALAFAVRDTQDSFFPSFTTRGEQALPLTGDARNPAPPSDGNPSAHAHTAKTQTAPLYGLVWEAEDGNAHESLFNKKEDADGH